MPILPACLSVALSLSAGLGPLPLAPVGIGVGVAVVQPEGGFELDLPDSPFKAMAERFFRAAAAGDEALLTEFYNDHFLPGMRERLTLEQHLGFARDLGRLIQHADSITFGAGTAYTALCYDEQGDRWVNVQVSFQNPDDPRVAGLGIWPSESPDVMATGASADDGAFAQALLAFAAELGEADDFSGALLVTRNGETVCSAAYGEADKRWGVPNTLDTKFNLGSANKFFTAIAICQLAEAGKLSYDQTVGDLLPDYPNEDVKRQVTVHHLLTHTGGTGSHFSDEFFEASKLTHRTLHDYIPLIQDNGVAFRPGSEMAYSNAGYFILGLIVEAVSGESYYDYVRAHVTGPAGTTGTDCYDADIPVPGVAVGYIPADEYTSLLDQGTMGDEIPGLPESAQNWRTNEFLHSIKGGPAGGGYSTVRDLCKIADAYMTGSLVSPDTRDLMTTGHTPFGRSASTFYGYGAIIETQDDGLRSFGHGGDFMGIQTRWTIVPDTQGDGYYSIAVMSNYAGAAGRIYGQALRLLPRR